MHFDGIIFDLDGTLWDCSRASALAVNRAYEKFGISDRVSDQFIKSISGKPSTECDELILAKAPTTPRNELIACYEELEVLALQAAANNSLLEGVAVGLPTLTTRYPLFLVSNCSEDYLKTFLEHSVIGPLFKDSECFGHTNLPKSANIRAVIERQKIKYPCYIGDTASDETAANDAGVPFFHVQYGFGTPIGTPHAFASFAELTRYFMELP